MVSFWIIQQSLVKTPPKKTNNPLPRKILPSHSKNDLCPQTPFPTIRATSAPPSRLSQKSRTSKLQRFFLKPHHWPVLEFSISKSLPHPSLLLQNLSFPPTFFFGLHTPPQYPGFPVAISPLGMLESYKPIDSQRWRRGFGELGKGGGVGW